jgi:hypothetical protein
MLLITLFSWLLQAVSHVLHKDRTHIADYELVFEPLHVLHDCSLNPAVVCRGRSQLNHDHSCEEREFFVELMEYHKRNEILFKNVPLA